MVFDWEDIIDLVECRFYDKIIVEVFEYYFFNDELNFFKVYGKEIV